MYVIYFYNMFCTFYRAEHDWTTSLSEATVFTDVKSAWEANNRIFPFGYVGLYNELFATEHKRKLAANSLENSDD